jgi:hypothetical protein
MTEIRCRRIGRKYANRWPSGRQAVGYSVLAERNENGRVSTWVAGFATQIVDNWGRKNGWIVLSPETGETILGAGRSTQIGNALGDCLYMFDCYLEELPPMPPTAG